MLHNTDTPKNNATMLMMNSHRVHLLLLSCNRVATELLLHQLSLSRAVFCCFVHKYFSNVIVDMDILRFAFIYCCSLTKVFMMQDQKPTLEVIIYSLRTIYRSPNKTHTLFGDSHTFITDRINTKRVIGTTS